LPLRCLSAAAPAGEVSDSTSTPSTANTQSRGHPSWSFSLHTSGSPRSTRRGNTVRAYRSRPRQAPAPQSVVARCRRD
jgi:hypothetical protein